VIDDGKDNQIGEMSLKN